MEFFDLDESLVAVWTDASEKIRLKTYNASYDSACLSSWSSTGNCVTGEKPAPGTVLVPKKRASLMAK